MAIEGSTINWESIETDVELAKLERAIKLERDKHERQMSILAKEAEWKSLSVLAERDKVRELVRSDSTELSRLKHERRLMEFDCKIKLAQEQLKQTEANYACDIKLRSQLEAQAIRRLSVAKLERINRETSAKVSQIMEIGFIKIHGDRCIQAAQLEGLRSVRSALEQYYKALVVDRLAGRLLNIIASKLRLDPKFRLKLERPLADVRIAQAMAAVGWRGRRGGKRALPLASDDEEKRRLRGLLKLSQV